MFRLFSRFAGPRFAASHAPHLFQAHFDFLEVQVPNVSDNAGSSAISNIPRYIAPAIVNQVIGITAGALECLGASGIDASYRDVMTSGTKSGFDMVACQVDFRWRLGREAADRPSTESHDEAGP
jgi:hypothetical protein